MLMSSPAKSIFVRNCIEMFESRIMSDTHISRLKNATATYLSFWVCKQEKGMGMICRASL
jgi:hypothetical protein